MINNKEKINLIKEFIVMTKKAGAWYSLTGKTLLNTVKSNEIFESDTLEVMMTITSYNLIKKRFPKNIEDKTINNSYMRIQPIFFLTNKKQHININIVVPSKVNKLYGFTNLKSKLNFFYSKLHSEYSRKTYWENLNFVISLPFKNKIKNRSHITVYNALFVKEHEGFFEITEPKEPLSLHWIPQLTFKTISTKLEGIEVQIPYESHIILTNWYGQNYIKNKH